MIIAGCGYTGRRLAKRLAEAGRDVIGLTGSAGSRDALVARGLTAHAWNLDAGEPAPALPGGCAIVYLVPPPRDGAEDTRLEHFLTAISDGPARLVYASTTGVYGNRDGALVDETAPPRPESDRARRRVDAERRIMRWGTATGVPTCVLRIPGIYGPDRLQLATLEAGRALLRPEEAGPGNRIHVDDLASCLQAALETDAPDRVINVGDGDHASNTEFVTEVARQLGRPAPPRAALDQVRAEASERRWSFMRESRRVDTTRMRRALGVEPRFGQHREGIAASLAEMGLTN